MKQIAILGFGVVGSGTAEVLMQNKRLIAERCGEELGIKYILDRRDFPEHPLANRVVRDMERISGDPEVAVVVEAMGGVHPAYEYTKAALCAGKSVVTSNKAVVAAYGDELLALARQHGVAYCFEAAVGGGIPVIRPIQTDLSSNHIRGVFGILNGTTNYMLTRMKEAGLSFEEALQEARALGYAEADPTADISGLDTARKTVILAALAFGGLQDASKLLCVGIDGIGKEAMEAAEHMGGVIKLIGRSERTERGILSFVSPHFVPNGHPLAHVNDVYNGILVDTDMLGRTMFYGAGAGKLPTASAVTSDIMDAVCGVDGRRLPVWTRDDGAYAEAGASVTPWLLLLEGCSRCAARAEELLNASACRSVGEGRFALITEPMNTGTLTDRLNRMNKRALLRFPVLS